MSALHDTLCPSLCPSLCPGACRALWTAVLTNALRDLCGCGTGKGADTQNVRAAARAAAEAWVGPWPRRDFRLVCDLAGLEPEAVHDRLRALIALSPDVRAQKMGPLICAVARPNPPGATTGTATGTATGAPRVSALAPAVAPAVAPAMRRARVKEMLDAGVAPSQMPGRFAAAGQAVPIATVYNDLRHLRQSGAIGYMRRPTGPAPPMIEEQEASHG